MKLHPLFIDGFAGGGGASTGIEQALGRDVDVAINHSHTAIAIHKANHPETEHHCTDIRQPFLPRTASRGRRVDVASPVEQVHIDAEAVAEAVRGVIGMDVDIQISGPEQDPF